MFDGSCFRDSPKFLLLPGYHLPLELDRISGTVLPAASLLFQPPLNPVVVEVHVLDPLPSHVSCTV